MVNYQRAYNTGKHGTGENNVDLRQDAKKKDQILHQRDDQSILDLKKTMLASLDRVEELGVEIPEGQDLAMDFMWKLDKKHYGPLD